MEGGAAGRRRLVRWQRVISMDVRRGVVDIVVDLSLIVFF